MKMLVSDFDGTFKPSTDNSGLQDNIDCVKRFMDNGNIFAFATGRNFNSIKEQTERFNIPYHYLICNNGSAIFDKKDNLVFYYPIMTENVVKTLKYLESLGFIKSIKLIDMFGQETSRYYDVIEIICTLKVRNIFDIEQIREEISFLSSLSFFNIVILKEEVDKKDGIQIISEKECVNKKDIYTVGDEFNDEQMLIEYNGYKMPWSNPKLYFKGIKSTSSVARLVRKIERK